MQNEHDRNRIKAESKSKLDDLKEKQFSFRNFRAKNNRDLTERAPSMSGDHAEQIHKIETGSVVFRFKASKKRTAFYWERKIK